MLKTSKALLDATFVKPWKRSGRSRRGAAKILCGQIRASARQARTAGRRRHGPRGRGQLLLLLQSGLGTRAAAPETWPGCLLATPGRPGTEGARVGRRSASGWPPAGGRRPVAALRSPARQIKLHAGRWYQRAFPNMPAGDTRDAVEAKLREMRLDANSQAVARGIGWLTERQFGRRKLELLVGSQPRELQEPTGLDRRGLSGAAGGRSGR